MIGQTLSHFKISAKLGEGGMGEVYRAEDTKLGRNVAIKVLPEALTADAERLARFEREAQVLASLNHPNVAGIHEIGHTTGGDGSGIHFLVMELVEGKDLASHLAKGPIPLETALPIALQVAQGLEAAHDRGIVHRDLKPANIMVGSDRKVKVLDFGLAKAYMQEAASGRSSLSMSPTLTAQMTQAGTLLGTAAYMSPEQARGEEADRRADIWAFGAVLMEMLTGQRVFPGKTVSDSLAGILAREPEWEDLPDNLPSTIRRLLERCLDKEVAKRLQAIGEARIAIERHLANPEVEAEASAAGDLPAPGRFGKLALAATAILAVLTGGVAVWLTTPDPPPPAVRKLHIPVDSRVQYHALSPDGKLLAFITDERVFIRPLDTSSALSVPDSEGAEHLFWSPDSEWLGLYKNARLWKIPARGGAAQTIGSIDVTLARAGGIAWLDDDTLILATGNDGLFRMPARGGELIEVLAPVTEVDDDFHQVTALPEDRGVLFIVHSASDGNFNTLATWNGTERQDVYRATEGDIWGAAYSHSGHVLFHQVEHNPGIWALPFSLDDLEATGAPFLVAGNARTPTISSDGTLAYVPGSPFLTPQTQLAWVDRSGGTLLTIGEPQRMRPAMAIAPDESRVVVEILEDDEPDLWILDAVDGTRTRLTFDGGEQPFWQPDGEAILFVQPNAVTRRSEIWIKRADGSGEARNLATGFFAATSPDGRELLYEGVEEGVHGIYRLDLDRPEEEPEILLSPARHPRISPNGRYIAYVRIVADTPQVFLTRYPELTGKWQVSQTGGGFPHWRADGREIFFISDEENIMAASVELGATPKLGRPDRLFRRLPTGVPMPYNLPALFAPAAEGERFVVALPFEGDAPIVAPITVVTNWFEEFREES